MRAALGIATLVLAACGTGEGTRGSASDVPAVDEAADPATPEVAPCDAPPDDGPLDLLPTDVPDDLPSPDLPGDLPSLDTPADLPPARAFDAIPADADPVAFALPADDPTPPVQLPDGVTIRVGTWNVYSAKRGTPEAIGAALAALDLDLVGLEECAADLAATIAAAAGFPYLAGDGDVLLSKTPIESSNGIALGTNRNVTHGVTTVDGVRLSVYVGHLSWQVEGVKECRQFVDEVLPLDPLPHLVFVGDFNDEHYSVQDTVLDQALADAFSTLGWHPGDRTSWPSNGFDETEGAQLIDLVWFRRTPAPLVLDGDVVNLSPTLSDHKPAWAELRYPRDANPFPTDPFAAQRDPWRDLPPAGLRPPNLLVNPGAEDGLAGWEVAGDARAETGRLSQVPPGGGKLFTGYPQAPDPTAPWSSGAQTVDLAGHAAEIDEGRGVVFAAAWLATGYSVQEKDGIVANIPLAYDDGEVIVEALDAAGGVLDRLSSGRRDPLRFDPWAGALGLPAGTRAARMTWLAHHKSHGGAGNDATFDDLYLGYGTRTAPGGPWTGNLLVNPGADAAERAGWEGDEAWVAVPDFQAFGPWGLDLFPPCSSSGKGMFYAGPDASTGSIPPGLAALGQVVPLGAFGAAIDGGGVAVTWGGRLRSYRGTVGGRLALEVLDGDGTVWHAFEAPEVRAAEWTPVRGRTRLPPGAAAVRLVVRATLPVADDGVFVDELSVRLRPAP